MYMIKAPGTLGSSRPPGQEGWGGQLASSRRAPCGLWCGLAEGGCVRCGFSGKMRIFVRAPISNLSWVRSFP